MSGNWIRLICLLAGVGAQVALLQLDWRVHAQDNRELGRLAVRSGNRLLIDKALDASDQPILHYATRGGHSHHVVLELMQARLSDAARSAFSQFGIDSPSEQGRILAGSDPATDSVAGKPCQADVKVEFGKSSSPGAERSVFLYPPPPGANTHPESQRILHLQSNSELVIHISANSDEGQDGPRCRNLITWKRDSNVWEKPFGQDLDWALVAVPGSSVIITMSGDFQGGDQELESLTLEPLKPARLAIMPSATSEVIQSRKRAGEPLLTVEDLRLSGSFLDVTLSGAMGIPMGEVLGVWRWPLHVLLSAPMLVWVVFGFVSKNRVFLSYSRRDQDEVAEVHRMLTDARANLWIDRKNILGGARWQRSIERQMRRSRQVLIFLSSKGIERGGFFWIEIGLATSLADKNRKDGFLIPVKLEDCELPEILMPYNCINYHLPGGREKLIEALKLDPAKLAARSQSAGL
jgi:hypothetical protein